jgi:hypothetical protein
MSLGFEDAMRAHSLQSPFLEVHMATTRENAQVSAARLRRKGTASSDIRSFEKRQGASAEEGHLGATERQVSKTLPPTTDDDEPKQG